MRPLAADAYELIKAGAPLDLIMRLVAKRHALDAEIESGDAPPPSTQTIPADDGEEFSPISQTRPARAQGA